MPSLIDRIRLGCRNSPLAQKQAQLFVEALEVCDVSSVLFPLASDGDRCADVPIDQIGGKGVFVRNLDQALMADRIDACIHSLKDVESRIPDGIVMSSVLAREDPRDILVLAKNSPNFPEDPSSVFSVLGMLPEGATVGTSSPRRRALLRHFRPDLQIVPIRGNVHTRLHRLFLPQSPLDAIVVASCGLIRLGLLREDQQFWPLNPAEFTPACGQGMVVAMTRAHDAVINKVFRRICDPQTDFILNTERSCLETINGSCQTAVGVFASIQQGQMVLDCAALSEEGRCVRVRQVADVRDRSQARELGQQTAMRLLSGPGGELLCPSLMSTLPSWHSSTAKSC